MLLARQPEVEETRGGEQQVAVSLARKSQRQKRRSSNEFAMPRTQIHVIGHKNVFVTFDFIGCYLGVTQQRRDPR